MEVPLAVVREFLDVRDCELFEDWGLGSSEGVASGESTRDSPEAGIFYELMSRLWFNTYTETPRDDPPRRVVSGRVLERERRQERAVS